MKTNGMIKRGLTALTAAAVLASTFVGLTGGIASAQDAGATPAASASASPAATPAGAFGAVGTSKCWTTPPTFTAGYAQWSVAPQMVIDPAGKYTATMSTNKGDITIELYAAKAPIAVNNFICLAGNGYYDLTLFHRILAGFVVQGGDPTATGRGGPGYSIADELPTDLKYDAGTLAMANAGANTGGSQFFICLDDLSTKLQKNYTIFGKVTGGMDIVTALGQLPVQATSPQGEVSSPVSRVGIVRITIVKQ